MDLSRGPAVQADQVLMQPSIDHHFGLHWHERLHIVQRAPSQRARLLVLTMYLHVLLSGLYQQFDGQLVQSVYIIVITVE